MGDHPEQTRDKGQRSELIDVMAVLVRNFRFIMLVTLAAAIIGGLISGLRPLMHSAFTTVSIQTAEALVDETQMETEMALAQTDAALRRAEAELPPEVDLEDATVEAEAPGVLTFGYANDDKALAEQGAAAMATTYLQSRGERLRERTANARDSLQERLANAMDEKRSIEARIQAGDRELETQRELLILRISRLEDALQSLDPYLSDLRVGEVVSSELKPANRAFAIVRGVLIGAILGLIMAATLLFLIHTSRRIVREIKASAGAA